MIALALVACVGGAGEDFDGDGFRTPSDCDDRNAFVHPGAIDTPYDGIDQDCSGSDETDGDGDGFDADVDCDDGSPNVHPGADDPPYDGVDQDCGGGSDFDADGDGSDSAEYGGSDCDDTDPSRSAFDADGDGWTSCGGDCDDTRAAVHPDAARVCGNGIDDDCDGEPECGLTGTVDLDGLDALITGYTSADYAGHSLAVVDDLDGDGRRDLAVGAYQAYDGNGAVHLITRPRDGTLAQDHTLLVGSGSFGWSVAAAPGGVIVGSLSGAGFDWRGAVFLFEPPLAPVMDERDASLVLEGAFAGDRAGWSVAYVELGGPAFIAVGAVSSDASGTDSGAVYFVPVGWTGIHDLTEAARLRGTTAWGRAGAALAPTPDVTGDGFQDLWVGEPGGDVGFAIPGSVWLVAGLPGSTIASSTGVSLVGEVARDQFGAALAVGDANGDAIPDVLVGAPYNDEGGAEAGAAYLFLGPHAGTRSAVAADLVVRGRAGYGLGTAVALVDLDGDGLDDVVVGGPTADADSGGVAVFAGGTLGAVDVLSGDAIVIGPLASRTGVALAGGLLDAGSIEDLAIGADTFTGPGGDSGAVSVAWGGDGSF
ncbi:MAG: FG-GAP repeat protein [Alphaproteobacteria bacterium]|nr:FG-GAP repeat protein [Alphaproteobacteria bacterium]